MNRNYISNLNKEMKWTFKISRHLFLFFQIQLCRKQSKILNRLQKYSQMKFSSEI